MNLKKLGYGLLGTAGVMMLVSQTVRLPNHIYEKHGMFREAARVMQPYRIVLHDTAGPTLSGAEETLKERRLGYHYMITKNGVIYEYVSPKKRTYHAYKNNTGTIGISLVGGYKYGAMTPAQREALIILIKKLKKENPTIREITGHKHVDPRGWKSDPMFPGEQPGKVDWKIDAAWMREIAKETDLTFINRSKLYGR